MLGQDTPKALLAFHKGGGKKFADKVHFDSYSGTLITGISSQQAPPTHKRVSYLYKKNCKTSTQPVQMSMFDGRSFHNKINSIELNKCNRKRH